MDTQDANNKPIGDMPEAPKQDSAEQPKPLGDVTFGGNTSNKKPMMIIGGIVAALVLVGLGVWWWLMQPGASNNNTGDKSGKTELVYAVHWLEDPQISGIKDKDGKLVSKGLQQYLDEYTSLHPDITFKLRQTHVSKYNDDLKVAADSGSAPDIYQIYSTWGPSYVRDGLFAAPPADVKEDIEKNYVSTVGATIDGKIWGYPTEINNYALLYNKDLFKAAGIANAPTTWTDVVNDAKKLTKRDAAGAITQYGIAFTRDTDWSVVDPYLSLLYSNGGDFLSSDYKKSVVNSPAGVAALNGMVQLFTNKSVDSASNFFDFKDGKVAMIIAPPWTKSTFAASFGDKFATTVGVAPFPYMKQPASMGYSWFTGVMKDSAHQQAAWDFLKWFSSDKLADGTTRYGTLLAENIGAIPARKEDFDAHKTSLGDFFTSVYIKQMKDAKAEPNVLESSTLKAALMTEIQSAWDGKKTSQAALDNAVLNIDKTLVQYYK